MQPLHTDVVTKLTIAHNPFSGGSRSGPRPGDLWDLTEQQDWGGTECVGHLETVLSVVLPDGRWDCYVLPRPK